MNKINDDWAKKNIKPEDRMECKKCGIIVDKDWIETGFDHKGLCGPCLNKEKK